MFWIFYFIMVIAVIRWLLPPEQKHVINIYFGVPGSGKTTFAAYMAKQAAKESKIITFCKKRWHKNKLCRWLLVNTSLLKRSLPVYSNVPITGTYELEVSRDIGRHHIENAKIIIDEAGIEYNNRNFKAFPPEAIYFYKYHRHYKTSIDVFSQSYDDMDITLRRLAQNYFVVKRSLIPFCISVKRIKRKIGIDEKHQIMDMYDFDVPVITTKTIYCPPLWKMFNSYSRKELEPYEFPVW